MARDTLIDFFYEFAGISAPFLVYDDGYRTWAFTYAQVAGAANAFCAKLRETGIEPGAKVLIWSENRPEWIIALWGCLLAGAVLVPIDYRASRAFLLRVDEAVQASLILIGDDVDQNLQPGDRPTLVWPLRSLSYSETVVRCAPTPQTLAEILFTSGATAEPKGVTITHRNILANIVPIETELRKYKKYAVPFAPIRFLNMLPLSHMFGQAMATFIPPMLPGIVIFLRGFQPQEVVRQVHKRRISVLVCVPRMLELLKDYIIQQVPEAAETVVDMHWTVRWWHYRRVHNLFGWKFWSFIVGAAPLPPGLETFWSGLGFVVIQGYGLTETAPIATLNHPFHKKTGTVGKPIGGVKVKLSEDGEILLRGENVTPGYYGREAETAAAFEDGWFHTGDIGRLDEQGNLAILGRKKEMIVTPEGLNVFPEDVESAILAVPGVREAAVVGAGPHGQERVHAVLLLTPQTNPEEVLRQANQSLEDHQKIRSASIWPDGELPKTEGTGKLKRREIAAWVAGERASGPPANESSLQSALARFAGGRQVTDQTTIEELGLSSLDRVQLLMELEQRLGTTLDEGQLASARTVGDLRHLPESNAAPAEAIKFPSFSRTHFADALRRVTQPTILLPLLRIFAWIRTEGREHLRDLEPPIIFAVNHQSLFDVPAVLAALPGKWRYRVAPAMAKEFFAAHFHPKQHAWNEWFTNSLNFYLSSLFFNAFPLPQREAGAREALRYAGELTSEGWCVLIFPEGKRTNAGEIYPFQPGVGMLASKLGVPVVPVRLQGLERVLHKDWKFPKPGRVKVTFGPALHLSGSNYAALARTIEDAVHRL